MSKVGIMLALERNDINYLENYFKLKSQENIPPHLTLYALEISKKDKKLIKNQVDLICKRYLPLEIFVNKVDTSDYGTVKLVVKNTRDLQKFHEDIVKEIVKYRDKQAFSKAIKYYDEFREDEQKLINEYGRPNVMQNFKPHITLGKSNKKLNYNFNKCLKVNHIITNYDEDKGWVEI